jgi:hypothetical protein
MNGARLSTTGFDPPPYASRAPSRGPRASRGSRGPGGHAGRPFATSELPSPGTSARGRLKRSRRAAGPRWTAFLASHPPSTPMTTGVSVLTIGSSPSAHVSCTFTRTTRVPRPWMARGVAFLSSALPSPAPRGAVDSRVAGPRWTVSVHLLDLSRAPRGSRAPAGTPGEPLASSDLPNPSRLGTRSTRRVASCCRRRCAAHFPFRAPFTRPTWVTRACRVRPSACASSDLPSSRTSAAPFD